MHAASLVLTLTEKNVPIKQHEYVEISIAAEKLRDMTSIFVAVSKPTGILHSCNATLNV